MPLKSGESHVGGQIAYVPQQAWIQNLTIRDNILFGKPYNETKYRDVVHACALEPDFQMLPQGDSSYGGLRGLNLSGGQRQRVNVARAAYFGADTILLDNALSCAPQPFL
jgi:ATP-binding cassette, subfamily C (CFTR/MRP), member 1